jgi:hypothetical protein
MIYVGIDDTDTLDTPGTNQLAKELARLVADDYRCRTIVRHQLFFDSRVPYTSKNGSASLVFEPRGKADVPRLIETLRARMRQWFMPGSDPGLCVTAKVAEDVTRFGQRAKEEIVTQAEAHALATKHGLHLEGLGGTNGGVIGALAAVGLIVTGDDGRIVRYGDWPDDLSGPTPSAALLARDVMIRDEATGAEIRSGMVDVGKHLRPNLRGGRAVLFVEATAAGWQALKKV